MKFAHLSDLHLGIRMNGLSLVEDQVYILDEIIGILKEEEVDAVLIAGDIYDSSQPSETYFQYSSLTSANLTTAFATLYSILKRTRASSWCE